MWLIAVDHLTSTVTSRAHLHKQAGSKFHAVNMYSVIKLVLLGLFPIISWCQTQVPPPDPAPIPPVVDVAIVGAGLAGLSAAKELLKAGKSFTIFEAQDRVGGRIRNYPVPMALGGYVEMGAQFVGPTQDRILELARSLNISTYKTYNTGNTTIFRNGTRSVFNGTFTTGSLPIAPEGLGQAGRVLQLLNGMAAELDVNAPWNHSRSVEWDSETLQSWMNREMPHPDAQFLLTEGMKSIFSTEPREQSLLYTLSVIASAGNSTTRGTFERLIDVTGGAQEQQFVGGAEKLALSLLDSVGGNRVLKKRSHVQNIELMGDNYLVAASARTVLAKHVIVAMSPALASRIIYHPPLPPTRDQLTQRMPMGSVGKVFAIFFRPFWREAGLNGQVVSDSGAVRVLFDSSPADGPFGAILCFIEADEMRRLDRMNNLEMIEEITQDLVRYFGPKAINFSGWDIFPWDYDKYARGGPAAYAPPGVLTAYGAALKAPHNRLHFAGTETSDYWVGYMEGAVRSGERAAAEVLANW
ncbi:hypothetical protein BBP40_008070 [Aspergillus hancockii]|nr:hypothetical protein BBP40_008070 [Aspergillus hancockii]